jgi:hypothetical protein
MQRYTRTPTPQFQGPKLNIAALYIENRRIKFFGSFKGQDKKSQGPISGAIIPAGKVDTG